MEFGIQFYPTPKEVIQKIKMKTNEFTGARHDERIICPECEMVQLAEVKHFEPFWSYIHNFHKCGYIITESEWRNIIKF